MRTKKDSQGPSRYAVTSCSTCSAPTLRTPAFCIVYCWSWIPHILSLQGHSHRPPKSTHLSPIKRMVAILGHPQSAARPVAKPGRAHFSDLTKLYSSYQNTARMKSSETTAKSSSHEPLHAVSLQFSRFVVSAGCLHHVAELASKC